MANTSQNAVHYNIHVGIVIRVWLLCVELFDVANMKSVSCPCSSARMPLAGLGRQRDRQMVVMRLIAPDVGGRTRRGCQSRACPAPPRSTSDHLANDASKMNVDGAVEDEIAGEVQSLQRIADGDGEIVRFRMYRRLPLRFFTGLSCGLAEVFRVGRFLLFQRGVDHLSEDVADLSRRHQYGVHDDDDGQSQRDGVGRVRLTVTLSSDVHIAVGPPASLELAAHTARVAYGAYQEEVGVGEDGQRQKDADDQIQGVVGPIDGDVTLQQSWDLEVADAGAQVDARDGQVQEARHVQQDAEQKRDRDRAGGEPHSDDDASLQRMTDGQIAADGHDNGQPGARSDEGADDGRVIGEVDQRER